MPGGVHAVHSSRKTARSKGVVKRDAGRHIAQNINSRHIPEKKGRSGRGAHAVVPSLLPGSSRSTSVALTPAASRQLNAALIKKLNNAPATRKAMRRMAQQSNRKAHFMMASAVTLLAGTLGSIYASAAGQGLQNRALASQIYEADPNSGNTVSRGSGRTSLYSEEESVSESKESDWSLEANAFNVDTDQVSIDNQQAKVAQTHQTPQTRDQLAGIARSGSDSWATYTTNTLYSASAPFASTIHVSHPTGDSGNAYAFSQCTWWAYIRRHQLGLPVGSHFGDAAQWAASAKALGYSVDNNPQVGDVIVFARGNEGSSSRYGHVGIVESVNSNGTITISECGAKLHGRIASRTLQNPGRFQFIHS